MVNPLKVCPQCGTEYPANARFCEIDGTALRSAGAEQDMVGSIVADRYHIMKKLGEGGMGQVYLAEHVKMGRKSALKVMHPGMVKDVDAISRFNREAANASKISHPNVAAVYDFGETADGIIFLAMEFVDGPPLTKVIEQAGALPAKRAAEIVRQTGEALAVAHDMGIVHRDLKPDNIMVAKTRDGGDLVKVVDFGIAKAAGSDAQKVTKTGLVVGTPEYMSPEQLAGDKLDGRSDIYSLGLVAFNMLTGKLPFPSDSAQESMIMRLTDKPKPLGEMRPEVSWPADVQAVMDKALEREVGARYQTATEFGRDLHRVIERMPETVAAELGTQMIQVPQTRVASSPAAPSPAAPSPTQVAAPPPATMVAPVPVSHEPVTHAAAETKKKSMVPVFAGIGVVVVVTAAVVVPKYLNKSNSPPSAPPAAPAGDTTNKPAASQAGGETKSQTTSNPAPAPNGKTTPAASNPAQNTGAAKPVADQLSLLTDDSQIPAKAADVLQQVKRLVAQAQTSKDYFMAGAIRYRAYQALKDTEKACNAWKDLLPHMNPADTQEAESRIALLSCPE